MLFEVSYLVLVRLVCKPTKFGENCISPEVDFMLDLGRILFPVFSRQEAVFGKPKYSPFSFSLGPFYEQNMSEIDFFFICATARSIFLESRS